MSQDHGHTLTELLITLAVAGTVAVLGAPAFAALIASSRLTAELNALHHVLHSGRREAIKRRLNLVLCQSTDGARCTGEADWSEGWILFVDSDDDGMPDATPSEPVLHRHDSPGAVTIRTNRQRYTLRGLRRRGTNGTFLVCDPAGRVPPRALIVSYTGRPRSAPGSDAPAALDCAEDA
ncbi:MAG: GspH/FimT family pseudopilin [Gammaproteobacteria bacterium]